MADLRVREARRLYQVGQLADAESVARAVLASDPDQPDALNIVALCTLHTGRAAEALPLLERVVQLKPHYAHSRAYLAALLLAQRRFAEAESHARVAIQLK